MYPAEGVGVTVAGLGREVEAEPVDAEPPEEEPPEEEPPDDEPAEEEGDPEAESAVDGSSEELVVLGGAAGLLGVSTASLVGAGDCSVTFMASPRSWV